MAGILEICLSPALYPYRNLSGQHITVVIDILRFTTSLIAAFDNGVSAVVPVATLSEAEQLREKGYPVAAEREGLKLPFADYGNSAADFRTPDIRGKTLVYSTTNGSGAMTMAAKNGPVAAAAFSNLPALSEWLNSRNENIVILCSGWKNLFSTEDTLCAGALAELLLECGTWTVTGDETALAAGLWNHHKHNLKDALINTSHYQRLLGLGVDPLPDYTVKIGVSKAIPVFENGIIKNIHA
jgi:2-phosphosulfolactate phosphatase